MLASMRVLHAFWAACLLTCCGTVAYAQALLPPPPLPAATVDPNALVDAFHNHQWALLEALGVYFFAAFCKQGWFSLWLAARIPKRALPVLVPLTGIALFWAGEVIAGKPWQAALVDGLIAGFVPVVGHAVVVDAARGGKEIVPETKAVTVMRTTPPPPLPLVSKPPAPPIVPTMVLALVAFMLARVAPLVVALFVACTPGERSTAKTILDFVLSGSQLACVELSTLTTSKEIAQACQIDLQVSPQVEPFIDNLLSQKAAARRAGFEWHPPPQLDAGTP